MLIINFIVNSTSASNSNNVYVFLGINERKFNAIQLTGIDQITLQLIVDYIYTSSIKIDNNNVNSLLEAANCLNLSSLQSTCHYFLDQIEEMKLAKASETETQTLAPSLKEDKLSENLEEKATCEGMHIHSHTFVIYY